MAAELDDLFASPEDCGLSRSSVCSRTRTGSENRTTTSQQPTLLPSPCDRVAAKRGLFLGSVARNAVAFRNPVPAHSDALRSGSLYATRRGRSYPPKARPKGASSRRLARGRSYQAASTHPARRDNLLQFFGPVHDEVQLAAVRAAPNHDEAAVGRDVVVR